MSNVKHPLNRSVTVVCIIFFGMLCLILSLVTYRLYTTTMYEKYQKQMESIVSYVQAHIDQDDMSECARTLVESEKYKETQAFFDDFIDHYEDIHYVYIMGIREAGAEIPVFEIVTGNSTYEKENEPDMVLHLGDGEADWYDEEMAQAFREIQEGDEDVYIINESEWGTDYTLARPMVDSGGNHYGLLCVDVAIDDIRENIYHTIRVNVALIILSGIIFILLLISWLRSNVTRPLKRLENSVTEFARSSAGKRNPDDLLFTPPDIRTQNEVASLSESIAKLSSDMRNYVKDIIAAEDEARGLKDHVSEMNIIAYQDALTHVKNKAAYDEMTETLAQEIKAHKARFGMVMADLNSLKVINDRYGHEKGDEYILGACKMICGVYRHSPVYRVGGDEFVVLLKGEDYRARSELLNKIQSAFALSSETSGMDPWHRYSAAVGMAIYEPGDDVETVYNRADREMYKEKAKMKKA